MLHILILLKTEMFSGMTLHHILCCHILIKYGISGSWSGSKLASQIPRTRDAAATDAMSAADRPDLAIQISPLFP